MNYLWSRFDDLRSSTPKPIWITMFNNHVMVLGRSSLLNLFFIILISLLYSVFRILNSSTTETQFLKNPKDEENFKISQQFDKAEKTENDPRAFLRNLKFSNPASGSREICDHTFEHGKRLQIKPSAIILLQAGRTYLVFNYYCHFPWSYTY